MGLHIDVGAVDDPALLRDAIAAEFAALHRRRRPAGHPAAEAADG